MMLFREEAFWVALAGFLVPLVNHFFGLGLEVGEVIATVVPAVVFIIGIIYKQTEVEKAMIHYDVAMINAGNYAHGKEKK